MAKTKYGDLIIKEDKLVRKGHFVDSIFSSWDNLKLDMHFNYHCISKPLLMVTEPHAHPCYEILGFIGGNPLNIRDFGGEVDLDIDGERHLVNSTCMVILPPGLKHCPINFRKVDRPFIFFVHLASGKYATLSDEPVRVDTDGNPLPPK